MISGNSVKEIVFNIKKTALFYLTDRLVIMLLTTLNYQVCPLPMRFLPPCSRLSGINSLIIAKLTSL
jgi:hypothetical protein